MNTIFRSMGIKMTTPPTSTNNPASLNYSKIEHWLQDNIIHDLKITWTAPWLYLEINRKKQRNALNGAIIENFKAVFDFIESRSEIRGVIITGGEQHFCAGADLQEIAMLRSSGENALIANNKNYGELLHRIHLCRIPVIAMVDGPALGGGMGLVCASDLIFCTKQASFGMPEPKLGIIAGQIFPYVFRKLGLVKTQEMSLQGLRIFGHENTSWGLANQVYDNFQDLQKGVNKTLDNILSCGPNAIEKTKTMLNQLTAVPHTQINQTARDVVSATLSTEGVEGTMAFLGKRQPKWNQTAVMES